MTEKEAIDRVREHIKTQPFKAIDTSGQCSFLTESGDRCFLGCLASTEEAARYVCSVADIAHPLGLEQIFCAKLMDIHDSYEPDTWPALLDDLEKSL